MNDITNMITNAYPELLDVQQQDLTFSQSTPYAELEFAKIVLAQHNIVVSIFPTLYNAIHAYESLGEDVEQTLFFGADEFVSAQLLSSSPELLLQRLQTLAALQNQDQKYWIITHVAAITRPIMPREKFIELSKKLQINSEIERTDLLDYLTTCHYRRVPIVETIGDFAVRGDVIDIFLPNTNNPIRISFFDTTVEMIFIFDVTTQLTIERIEQITIMPMTDQALGENQSLLSYFNDCIIVEHHKERIETTFEHMCIDALQFMTKNEGDNVEQLYIDYAEATHHATGYLRFEQLGNQHSLQAIDLIAEKKYDMQSLRAEVNTYLQQDYHLLCLVGNEDITMVTQELAKIIDIKTPIMFSKDIGYNEVIHTLKLIVIDYADYMGLKLEGRAQNNQVFTNLDAESKIQVLDDIQTGDYIVHTKYGVGRYDGIQTITAQGVQKDYIVLTYYNDEKIYLPTEKIDTLYKYVGSKDNFIPKVSKIGDKTWKKKTERVQEHIEEFTQELFTLYMERQRIPGFAFAPDSQRQKAFEADFMYQETSDQEKAIAEIKQDMEAPFVMERILCGDVGFGKTEVAFRAAFKAIENGKQVVMLAPTTILAKQHYENAKKRFADYDCKVAMLSRLVTKKEQEQILFHIELGDVDLLIGTHRVLSDDVQYDDLGLVIIDEEHRFGVAAKDKLKKFKTEVDVLLISATPIPRTLQMAITGIREMSLLQTPPHNRYPVQTYVIKQNEHIVKDAIERELSRHGQTFYLYNKVQTIGTMTNKLQELIPQATIKYAHGQMSKTQLENIIQEFVDKKIDVLVSTTIIENGMDIPNANTLIVHDADLLGLAQLYQLRGRVGRSDKIAYSYFMYHPAHILTEEALKRLQAVQSFTEFGSGYNIAMRDLAIRGAGDVLGKTQSGFINDVGFDLYVDMLQSAIAKQKNEPEQLPDLFQDDNYDVEVNLNISAFVPTKYVSDESVKIDMYQMISKIKRPDEMASIVEHLTNRFGAPPQEVINLIYVFLFRALGQSYQIKYIRQVKNKVFVQFNKALTQNVNKVTLFKKMHGLDIEVKYHLEALQLAVVTMRKEPSIWLEELLYVILETKKHQIK